jgi:pyruvate dehydrogenase E1 component
VDKARRSGAYLPYRAQTAYINTIPPHLEEHSPGDQEIEQRLRSLVRWNAVAMVLRAGKKDLELGGHIASFASAATLYDVGFNHFWNAPTDKHGGDLIYMQGHSSPGVYARAFLEGRLSEAQLDMFRQEVDGKGISSYPASVAHAGFLAVPDVSMGLGRCRRSTRRASCDTSSIAASRRPRTARCGPSWATARWTRPESLGAIGHASRESLDNLVFVINCNLQRLDGPVRGNGKIIQELEATFRGAGWNVIKVIWGSYWDPLLARDKDGPAAQRMEEAVDGEYQKFKSRDGAYVREHFFGKYPELKAPGRQHVRRGHLAPEPRRPRPAQGVRGLRGGVKHKGQPTVILAKTVKGYGMGAVGEGKNIAHQQKKMPIEALKQFRDRFNIPIADDKLGDIPYFKPADDSPEMKYLRELRAQRGGSLPQRRRKSSKLEVPKLETFKALLDATGEGREISTTMAFVRMLTALVKDKGSARTSVPIVPTSRAPSAWRASSASSASTRRSASSTSPRTATS